LKTQLLFIVIALLFVENAYAVTDTWTGANNRNWGNGLNWSLGSAPNSGEDVSIGGGTPFAPNLNFNVTIRSLTITSSVTINLLQQLTVNKTLDITAGTLTFAGANSASFGLKGTIGNGSAFVIGSGNTVTFGKTVTLAAGGALTNKGTLDINGGLVASGSPSPIINTGTINISASLLDIEPGGSMTNTGTITTNAGSTVKLGGSPSPLDNNLNGVFTAVSTAFVMAGGSSITNSGGTFTLTSSSISCFGSSTPILNANSGATLGTFTLNASTITFNRTNTLVNYGVFTANNGSSISTTVNANTCSITNYGTFYAGTSNSPCTITFALGSALSVNNASKTIGATTYNGTFYLGSTSIIYPSVASSSISNSSGCTFTLQSDIFGSASIGALGGTITGLYNVERYLSGGTSAYRSYRDLSSPVYATTVGGNNVYSINYVKLSALLTGTAGTAGGFDKAGNPTLYLYRDNLAPSNSSFTGGNFRGIGDISADPSYTIDGDGSGYNIPVGNGFMFFDRGDRTTNLVNKYSPGTVAESITLTASGTLNTGPIIVKPWFTLLPTLDYTAVTGNASVQGLAFVGNPYASSIDWDTFSSATSTNGIYGPNVSPFIYVIDPLGGSYNVYQQGNGGNGTLAATGSNIIPSGQGFFVSAFASGASLTFNEAAKTSTQATPVVGDLFLGPPPLAAVSQFLNLKLVKDSAHAEGLIVKFDSKASQRFVSGEDAVYKSANGPVTLSSISADNVALAINSQALPKSTQSIIPLNVNAAADGTYQLKMAAIKSIPELYDIWLIDAYAKDSLDMRHNPTYAFTIANGESASYGPNRFSLVIRQNQALMVHLLNFTASKITDGAQVEWKTENEQNYTNFTVERSTDGGATFNVMGGSASNAGGTYSLLDKAPAAGENLYRLKIMDLNGTITYSSTAKLMYSDANGLEVNNINIYPNPAAGVINLTVNENHNNSTGGNSALQNLALTPGLTGAGQVTQPAYDIKIINITGSVVKTATSSSSTWQNNVSNLSPGTYIIQVVNDKDKTLVGKSTFVKM